MEGKLVLAAAVVVVVLAGFLFTLYSGGISGLLVGETIPLASVTEPDKIPQLSLDGYVMPEMDVTQNSIIFSSGCQVLSMDTTEFQTNSIERGRQDFRDFRPLTHDLIQDILDTFGMEVMMVKVERMENGVYFSKVLIKQDNKILNLDAKPSDAIAIAVRADAPVYVSQDLMEEAGVLVC